MKKENILRQLVEAIENPYSNDVLNFARFVAIALMAKEVLKDIDEKGKCQIAFDDPKAADSCPCDDCVAFRNKK